MQVNVIKPIGYCFGVIKAINEALKIRNEHIDYKIFVFGLLVHNDYVINLLKEKNIDTIDITSLNIEDKLESFTQKDIVIFTAHGHPKYYEEILKRNNVTFFDTTCPNVKRNLEFIENSKNTPVIFIGQKNHPETTAAISIKKDVYLYDILSGEFDYNQIKEDRVIVLNQTTLSFQELKSIHQNILSHIPNAEIVDEICGATRIRQENVLKIKNDIDLLIVVGSTKSSNTRKLYETAINNLKNADVYMVNSIKELENIDLKKYRNAALTSGTSAPMEIIDEIEKYLKEI